MLILSRFPQEIIRVGNDIQIVVLSIKSNNVRIGIDAPKNINIYREELYLRISKEQELNIKQRMFG